MHDAAVLITAPDAITDTEFNPDSIRTTTGTLANTERGGTYSGALEEQFLIDAGAGKVPTITFGSNCIINSSDYVFIYDGKETNSEIVGKYTGQTITNGTAITGSTRYLFLRFTSWNRSSGNVGWTTTITHN